MAKRAAGPSLSGRVVLVEGPVDDRGADLEHQMRSSRRPTHLLVGAHPPVRQPMHRSLGGRRRYWLVVSPGGGIIDDQTGVAGYVSLEATKHAGHLTRRRSMRRYRFGRGIEYHQGVSDEIERPLYLPVPETPTDMLDGVGQAGSFRAVARRGVRPALGGLSDTTRPKLCPGLCTFRRWSATTSMSYGISGSKITSAPPAMPARSAMCPAPRPITSSTMIRSWLAAVGCKRSSASVTTSTVVLKPTEVSVMQTSLSISARRSAGFLLAPTGGAGWAGCRRRRCRSGRRSPSCGSSR